MKYCTLIKWLNSLTSLVESPFIATTLQQEGEAKCQARVFQKGKCMGVANNVYSRKMLEKPKRGLQILKIRVRELFTHGEGISTPRTCHKGRQPLIECAKTWLQIYLLFPFIYFFFTFWGRQECCLCSYISSSAMRNSDLRSSLSMNICVLNWFYVFERFILIANKKLFKALDLETMF